MDGDFSSSKEKVQRTTISPFFKTLAEWNEIGLALTPTALEQAPS